MQTEKLYYEDSHMKTFIGTVQSCEPSGDMYEVVLDRTAFFPEGGGQYADTGMLGVSRVVDVHETAGVIRHTVTEPLSVGSEVNGSIDWEERFSKMQQHTGEHIVSGLIHGIYGYDNVGFHLGSEAVTMDFNGVLTKEQVQDIEWRANQAVVENLEIEVSYPAKEVLKDLAYRSKIEIEGQVRIVTIGDYDVCACCAPHVKYTGEIGLIKLIGVQNYKGGVRISMLCGFRALEDYRAKENYAKAISQLLSAKETTIVEAVEHLKEEVTQLKGNLAASKREMFRYKVSGMEVVDKRICLFEQNLDGNGLRELANLLMDKGVSVCAVFTGDEVNGYRYVIGSRIEDVRPLSKALNEQFAGRGGGKPKMVQGSLCGDKEMIESTFQEYCFTSA